MIWEKEDTDQVLTLLFVCLVCLFVLCACLFVCFMCLFVCLFVCLLITFLRSNGSTFEHVNASRIHERKDCCGSCWIQERGSYSFFLPSFLMREVFVVFASSLLSFDEREVFVDLSSFFLSFDE